MSMLSKLRGILYWLNTYLASTDTKHSCKAVLMSVVYIVFRDSLSAGISISQSLAFVFLAKRKEPFNVDAHLPVHAYVPVISAPLRWALVCL